MRDEDGSLIAIGLFDADQNVTTQGCAGARPLTDVAESAGPGSVERMVAGWRESGLPYKAGAPESGLDHFEQTIGVSLPRRSRKLYGLTDRMDDTMDEHLFYLWPLDRIIKEGGVERHANSVRICFGDFLIDSHRYLLELGPQGRESVVVDANVGNPEMISASFLEFVTTLLSAPDQLLLMSSERK